MLQLARLRRDPAEIKSFIRRSLTAGHLLEGLLDDTLDLTRLEQGRAILNVGPLSPPALARNCIELVEPAAARKHIELVLHIEEAVASAGTCEGDARRLTQVLLNLLNNAIKFTPTYGMVSLGLATRKPSGPGASNVLPLVFHVRDTGIGICAEDMERIFMKYTKATFTQCDELGVDRHAGAGLGLSICKARSRSTETGWWFADPLAFLRCRQSSSSTAARSPSRARPAKAAPSRSPSTCLSWRRCFQPRRRVRRPRLSQLATTLAAAACWWRTTCR